MPLLRIQTNITLDPGACATLEQLASKTVSDILGKSEKYIMIIVETGVSMFFSGSREPLAYLELKSIGLPGERTQALSKDLCELIQRQLDIPSDRVYISFTDVARNMWGWNGATFER